jgi:hypothetical protein
MSKEEFIARVFAIMEDESFEGEIYLAEAVDELCKKNQHLNVGMPGVIIPATEEGEQDRRGKSV